MKNLKIFKKNNLLVSRDGSSLKIKTVINSKIINLTQSYKKHRAWQAFFSLKTQKFLKKIK